MKEIDFDVTLQTGELYSFTMRHTYCSVSGVFGLLISIGSLLVCLVSFQKFTMTTNLVLLFIGVLFTVIQPLMLYGKCKAQIRRSESINAALHYILSEDGICVCQGENKVQVKWYEVRKAVRAKKGMYLYLSPVRAFIFPKEQCKEKYDAVCSFVAEQMERYQDYVPEDEEEKETGGEVQAKEAEAVKEEAEQTKKESGSDE
jgi:hypothetical protein